MPSPERVAGDAVKRAALDRQLRFLIPITAMLILVASGLAIFDFGGFSRRLLQGSLVQHSIFASVLCFSFTMILGPNRRELIIMTLTLVIGFLVGSGTSFASPIIPLSFGLAAFLALLSRTVCDCNSAVTRLLFVLCASLLLPVASTIALVGQQLTTMHESTFDIHAYIVDSYYGFSASSLLGARCP